MSTAELLQLCADAETPAAARQIAEQELLRRNDAVAPVQQQPTEPTRRRARGFLAPSPYHKLVHISAVVLALPLLKVANLHGWLWIAIAALAAWGLSSRLLFFTATRLPKAAAKWLVWGLPALYFGLYYGAYLLLYRLYQ